MNLKAFCNKFVTTAGHYWPVGVDSCRNVSSQYLERESASAHFQGRCGREFLDEFAERELAPFAHVVTQPHFGD